MSWSYEANLICDDVVCRGSIVVGAPKENLADARASAKQLALGAGWSFGGGKSFCPQCQERDQPAPEEPEAARG